MQKSHGEPNTGLSAHDSRGSSGSPQKSTDCGGGKGELIFDGGGGGGDGLFAAGGGGDGAGLSFGTKTQYTPHGRVNVNGPKQVHEGGASRRHCGAWTPRTSVGYLSGLPAPMVIWSCVQPGE